MKKIILLSMIILTGCSSAKLYRWGPHTTFTEDIPAEKKEKLERYRGVNVQFYLNDIKPDESDTGKEAATAKSDVTVTTGDTVVAISGGKVKGAAENAAAHPQLKINEDGFMTINKNIEFIINNGYQARTGDRISWARLYLQIEGENYVFSDYSSVKTVYDESSTLKASNSRKTTLDAKLTPALAATIAGSSEVGAQLENNDTLDTTFSSEREDFTISIQPNEMTLFRNGAEYKDVSGKYIVDTKFKFNNQSNYAPPTIVITRDGKNLSETAKWSDFSYTLVNLPTFNEDLKLNLDVLYQVRIAGANARTLNESDDNAVYATRYLSECHVTRVEDLLPDLWQIGYDTTQTVLMNGTNRGDFLPVLFTHYADAVYFVQAMKSAGSKKINGIGELEYNKRSELMISQYKHSTSINRKECPEPKKNLTQSVTRPPSDGGRLP